MMPGGAKHQRCSALRSYGIPCDGNASKQREGRSVCFHCSKANTLRWPDGLISVRPGVNGGEPGPAPQRCERIAAYNGERCRRTTLAGDDGRHICGFHRAREVSHAG